MSSTSFLFLYCLFGSRVPADFIKYSEYVYESLWYELPKELQRTALIIIENGQHQVHFDALGMFSLNLVTFTQVATDFHKFVQNPLKIINFSLQLDCEDGIKLLFVVQDTWYAVIERNFPGEYEQNVYDEEKQKEKLFCCYQHYSV